MGRRDQTIVRHLRWWDFSSCKQIEEVVNEGNPMVTEFRVAGLLPLDSLEKQVKAACPESQFYAGLVLSETPAFP